MGALAPLFFERAQMKDVHTKERQLEAELSRRIEEGVPGAELLAVELLGPERICLYIDHPQGVDHALCERVTSLLEDVRRTYGIDVSSPGIERPLRKPQHFARVVGRRVALRTAAEIAGRKRFRGEVVEADERAVRVATEPEPVLIPYEQIVRGNLIDEGR
jgi:ribosome maturation factor RimP